MTGWPWPMRDRGRLDGIVSNGVRGKLTCAKMALIMGDYWKDAWARISGAEWLADTGLPLLLAILGLGLTYWLVRKQLKSDRELRHADHRREAASRLGSALVQASRRLKETSTDSPWWESHSWSDSMLISEAIWEARGILPDSLLDSLHGLAVFTEDLWLACWVSGKRREPDARFHAVAVKRVLNANAGSLDSLGVALRAWDGVADLSLDASRYDMSTHSSAQQNEERKAVYSQAWDHYESELDKLEGKAGVSLIKPGGRLLSQ